MKKRTHFALSKYLVKDKKHELSQMDRALFCLGSIFPDMTPLCLLHPHKFNITDKSSQKRLNKVFEQRNHFANSFRLGCLSHHLADYFTAPHNRSGIKGFCMDHRGYETRFDTFFKQQLADRKQKEPKENMHLNLSSPQEFWVQMKKKHDEYMSNKDESFHEDYSYIYDTISNLFTAVQKKRKAATP